MSRLPRIAPEEMTAEQRRIADEIASGPRGTVPAPQQIWLQSPVLADRAQKLGEFCRYFSSLPPALSELAILVTGAHWKAEYEWWAHSRIAREAGVPDAVIEAIRVGREPVLEDAKSRAVYRVARELNETRTLSEVTYREAEAVLGRQSLVDLVGILGYYCLISMTLNAFAVETPDGSRAFA